MAGSMKLFLAAAVLLVGGAMMSASAQITVGGGGGMAQSGSNAMPTASGSIATAGGYYADPRDYGAKCSWSTYSTNDDTNDDAPGFNEAMQLTFLPVIVPLPGCKLVTQVQMHQNGNRIFSFGSGSQYFNNDGANTPPYPHLFIPDAAVTDATNSCAIDTMGFDGVQIDHISILGTNSFNGTVAICNSVGLANSAPAAFLGLYDVYVTGVANAVGTAMTAAVPGVGDALGSGCDATGPLGSPVFQIRASHVTFDNTCTGFNGNFSDLHLDDAFFANQKGPCFSAPAGTAIEMVNVRCEYNYNFYGVKFNGAGFYFDNSGVGVRLANITTDHTYGPAFLFGDGSSFNGALAELVNIKITDAAVGGIAPTCDVEFNATYGISGLNVQMTGFNTLPSYALCFDTGNESYITWHETFNDGPAQTQGWNTAFTNFVTGTPGTLDIVVPGIQREITDATPSIAVHECLAAPSNTLPTASASQGQCYTVSNASAPAIGSTVVQTGSAWAEVKSNGTVWKVSMF
jgi:hypothetical protein